MFLCNRCLKVTNDEKAKFCMYCGKELTIGVFDLVVEREISEILINEVIVKKQPLLIQEFNKKDLDFEEVEKNLKIDRFKLLSKGIDYIIGSRYFGINAKEDDILFLSIEFLDKLNSSYSREKEVESKRTQSPRYPYTPIYFVDFLKLNEYCFVEKETKLLMKKQGV